MSNASKCFTFKLLSMAYKILFRKPEPLTTQIVTAIKKQLGCTTEEAFEQWKFIEKNKGGEDCLESNSLEYVLDEFYEIEHIPEPAHVWGGYVQPYTDQEEVEAKAWLETLSEEQKRHVEVLKYAMPVFTGPFC